MDKPTKPTNLLPESFGGEKENFDTNKITNGYEADVPDILGGANLNYLLDAAGKNFKYNNEICDFVNELPINNIITVDNNNKLIYRDFPLKEEITSWSFPDSSKAVNLTLLASGQSYTQPVDGYYAISKTAGKQNAYVSMYSGGLGYTCPSPNTQGHCVLSIWAPANQGCVINYDATGDVVYFRFIPAKGAVNE